MATDWISVGILALIFIVTASWFWVKVIVPLVIPVVKSIWEMINGEEHSQSDGNTKEIRYE